MTEDLATYREQLLVIWDALVRRDSMPEKADVIVVGGCRDSGLAERAAELYHMGACDLIVVSGYQPKTMDRTEAEFLANKCIGLGVPKNRIELEERASNTGENILFAAEMIKHLKADASRIILVHKPFMSLRFLATAEAQWPRPQPRFYTTCQSISFDDYCETRGLEAVAWEMLGDFKRMDEYVEKGYQTAQPIPDEARKAYDEIVRSGFATR